MTVRAILAMDSYWGIGKAGTIPWPKNKADLRWFRETTENNIVMMGRATWEDPKLPKPLPKRYNIVVSSKGLASFDTRPNMVIKRDEVERYINAIEKDIWVIGGEQLVSFLLTKKLIEEVHVNVIEGDYSCTTRINLPHFGYEVSERHEYLDRNLKIAVYRAE